MSKKNLNQAVKDYYDNNQILYTLFYSIGTGGLHYGFWEDNTKSHAESIMNNTKFVVNQLKINPDDRVLDAGCGVGSASIYIAKNYGAEVVGITLSDVQLRIARKKALKERVSDKASFFIKDYLKTGFPSGSFSKIFGLESVCYAEHKIDFLNEAFRLLKKGGVLVVADGFRIRDDFSEYENKIYNDWLKNWALPNIASVNGFRNDLKKAGFKNIRFFDKSHDIEKTSKRIYRLGIMGYPFTFLLSFFGIIPKNVHGNTIAMLNQKKLMVDRRLVGYGVFVAEK